MAPKVYTKCVLLPVGWSKLCNKSQCEQESLLQPGRNGVEGTSGEGSRLNEPEFSHVRFLQSEHLTWKSSHRLKLNRSPKSPLQNNFPNWKNCPLSMLNSDESTLTSQPSKNGTFRKLHVLIAFPQIYGV